MLVRLTGRVRLAPRRGSSQKRRKFVFRTPRVTFSREPAKICDNLEKVSANAKERTERDRSKFLRSFIGSEKRTLATSPIVGGE